MKKFLSMALALTMMVSLAACGAKEAPAASTPAASAPAASSAEDKVMVYAVEAGSAGEAAAIDAGYEITSVETQAAALMEVAAGTSDAAIIDSLMAGAMVGEGTSYPDLKCTDEKLTEELYGVGCRKGSNLAAYINGVFAEAYADGTMQAIAETYGVQEALVEQTSEIIDIPSDGDVAYIVDKGTLIVGITDFAPMDYKDDNGNWIGFDADMAKLVAEKLGVEIEFIEINWDNKVFELDGKAIDVVWNGMTLTDAMLEAMECSTPYCNNAQVVVTK
ncbi:MAG: transporter substrate-binding domain-containing protein [Oscillibacter sp.]|nr:transporter substrate-binding domain-containing protein [Oscillibacter sp.]